MAGKSHESKSSGEIAHISRRLYEEGEITKRFFISLNSAEWEQPVYTIGSGWKVRQILAHFVSAEGAYQRYLQDVLEGGRGAPKEMDIDEFNEAEVPPLSLKPINILLNEFQQARCETIRLVESLSVNDLNRLAFHPWFGEKEVRWYLKLLYRHNLMHLQDIRKVFENTTFASHSEG